MGRHAAPGLGRFTRELSSFAVRLLAVAVLFFGAIWAVVTYVPQWIAGDDATLVAVEDTTTTSVESQPTVLSSAVSTTAPPPPTTTTAPPATTTTVPPERPPQDIVVLVLNSTNRSGLAAGATALLNSLGYQTLEPDNSTPVLSGSQILYAQGFAAEAFKVAAQFTDGEVLANPSEDPPADIVVILGTSYSP